MGSYVFWMVVRIGVEIGMKLKISADFDPKFPDLNQRTT